MQTSKVIPIGLAKSSGNGKRRIDAEQVLNDIRSGMSDQSLMNKYALSAKGLQSLFEKLLDAGLITQSELEDRMSTSEQTVEIAISEFLKCDSPQFSESGDSPNGSAITTEQVMQYARDLGQNPCGGEGQESGTGAGQPEARRGDHPTKTNRGCARGKVRSDTGH